MKKIFLRLSIVLSIFIAFTSCGSRMGYYPTVAEHVFDDVVEATTDNPPSLDESMPANPHPLAKALGDYIAGNIAVHNPVILYPELYRISSEVRSAELVTLDDMGTMGVLLEIDDDVISKVLLYIYNDELLYSLQGWVGHGAFGAGRYNRLMSDSHGQAHIYTLESGRLVISTWWVDAYVGWGGDQFRFNGQYVTEDEFNTLVECALVRYGMDGPWVYRDDQTDQILAMTINCVPDLTTTSTQTNE
jgi:hypothetical protein